MGGWLSALLVYLYEEEDLHEGKDLPSFKRGIVNSKKGLNKAATSKTLDIPKGYFAGYVGESQKCWNFYFINSE
ncbi:hypothetical protein ACE6H2_026848 [Prunus campanulata]